MAVSISVIIPVLHEQERINGLISQLRSQDSNCEIIVVDGDVQGLTIATISDQSVVTLTAAKGRGTQLSAGAVAATGDIILMLHADTLLPDSGLRMVADAVADGAAWGAFRLGIDAPGIMYRVIERMVDLRCKLFSLPYGDQAIFVTHPSLNQIGGIPVIPLMEDVTIVRSLTQACGSCRLLLPRVHTSARRWQQDGILRRTMKNWWLLVRYLAGASPDSLSQEYR